MDCLESGVLCERHCRKKPVKKYSELTLENRKKRRGPKGPWSDSQQATNQKESEMKAKDETTQKAVSLMRKYKRVAEKAAALSRVAENEQVRNYIKVYRLILLNRFLSISKHRSNSLTVKSKRLWNV